MVRQLNKKIENKLESIIDYIKETPDYKNYLKAKELINKDEELKNIIEKIKDYQKKIVKTNDLELKKKYELLVDKLNNNILYNQYLEYLTNVNNMLNIFENKLNKYFLNLFN